MPTLNPQQAERLICLDSVLNVFRGQHVDDMPDTTSLLAMAEWVLDGTGRLASDNDTRTAELYSNRTTGWSS